jgi:hypothetical protein
MLEEDKEALPQTSEQNDNDIERKGDKKFCTSCGVEYQINDKFCAVCGHEISSAFQKDMLILDYEQTTEYFRLLTDIRFRLLAFVPAVSGLSLAVYTGSKDLSHTITFPIGILGFVAILGIMIYDMRNTQLYEASLGRAIYLENNYLKLPNGGLFKNRPERKLWLFGKINIWHDLGLALIYGASLGGWFFVIIDSLIGRHFYIISILSSIFVGYKLAYEYIHPNKKLVCSDKKEASAIEIQKK